MKNFRLGFRPSWVLALLLGLIALAPVSRATNAPDAQRILEGTLTSDLHVVHIDHRFGPVTVTGVDQDFGWRWVLSCSGDNAKAFVKESQLEVLETAGTLDIRFVPAERDSIHQGGTTMWKLFNWAWNSSRGSINMNSHLELRVPHAVTLELQNRFGAVTATSLRGSVNLDCQHSQLNLTDIAGAITASTSFARLNLERTGPARLRNQNGEILALNVGGDLRAASSFAKLRVQGIKGRAELKNQNGEIEASDIEGDLVAASSFARIQVRHVGGRADLHDQNGRIDVRQVGRGLAAESSFSELHVEDVAGPATLKCQNGKIEAFRVEGDVTAANSYSPMRVEDIKGDAFLESQNGEIIAHSVTGSVSAKTSFARIQLDGDGKRFDARNQNGAVQITARSATVERIAATTSFAPIDVSLPSDSRPLIRANTSFGKVHSEFPVFVSDTMSDATFNGDSGRTKITLNGKNGDIRVTSVR